MTDSIPQNGSFEYAQTYVQACLAGKPALEYPEIDKVPTEIQDVVRELYASYQSGDLKATNELWKAILSLQPSLSRLSNPEQRVFYHASELYKIPKPTYALEPRIPNDALILIYGATGSCKTFFSLGLAFVIGQKSPVVYVGIEGKSGYYSRVEAIAKTCGVPSSNVALNLTFQGLNMGDLSEVQRFIDEMSGIKPSVVFLDTLARVMEGDENSAKDMGQIIKGCDLIRNSLGASVVIIHHTPKAGGSPRGSNALPSGVDVAISLQNDDGVVIESCEKMKDGPEYDKCYYRLEEVLLDDGTTGQVLIPTIPSKKAEKSKLSKTQRAILDALAKAIFVELGATSQQVATATDIKLSTVWNRLSELKKAGLVRQSSKSEPYFITKEGLAAIGMLDTPITTTQAPATTSDSQDTPSD